MIGNRGKHQKLHDLVLEVRNELHRLDGTEVGDYIEFNNKKLKEAAAYNHLVYSLAVETEQETKNE